MKEERWRALRQSHRALHEAKHDGPCADDFDEIGNQFEDTPPLTWSQMVSMRESQSTTGPNGPATPPEPLRRSPSPTLEEVAVEATDEKQDPFSRVKAAHFKLQKAHASPEWVKQVSLFLDQQMGEGGEEAGGALVDPVARQLGGEVVAAELQNPRLDRSSGGDSKPEGGTHWWNNRLSLFARRQLGRLCACVGGGAEGTAAFRVLGDGLPHRRRHEGSTVAIGRPQKERGGRIRGAAAIYQRLSRGAAPCHRAVVYPSLRRRRGRRIHEPDGRVQGPRRLFVWSGDACALGCGGSDEELSACSAGFP